MSWAVLHAGKFVDADGVVVNRAEHEFLARSSDLEESVLRLIARQDPAPRLPPVQWLIGGHLVMAAFTQMMIRVDGVEMCLRVIDHQAFEGAIDRPGRAYRKRTYLVKPADRWAPEDAALPLDLIVQTPHYQQFTECPPWESHADAPVDVDALRTDLDDLMSAGRMALGEFIDDEAIARITAVLASLPPLVASRLHVGIGERSQAVIQAPGAAGDKRAEDAGCGPATLAILRDRGAFDGTATSTHRLANAAAQPWRFAEPAWALVRPFSEIRADLAWVLRCEAWLIDVAHALDAGKAPPVSGLLPSERLLKAALGLFIERDAIDRLGVLAGDQWEAAWQRIEVPAWRPVIDLLAGRDVEDGDLTVLSVLPLADDVAKRATHAWEKALDDSSHGALVALLKSTQAWCQALVDAHRPTIVGLALTRICEQTDPRSAWDAHPIRGVPEGRAIHALLTGAAIGAQRLTAIQAVGAPVADIVALLGDVAANARCFAATGAPGQTPRAPPALRATLDWLGGLPVTPVDGIVDVWRAFDAPVDVATSLAQGVPPGVLEACLATKADRIVVQDAGAAVQALLAQGDRVDRHAWRSVFTGGAWELLAAGHPEAGAHGALLDGLTGLDAIAALCLYTGSVRPSWVGIGADDVVAWLDARRPVAPLVPLAAAGAGDAIAAGLSAYIDQQNARNTHPGHGPAVAEAGRVLERLLADKGWLARSRVKRQAKRLVGTP